MSSKNSVDQSVEVNFESHPPIDGDLDGITNLLRQTLFTYTDCNAIAQYLIELKEVTQVIALEAPEEEKTSGDDDDEADDDIYGVTSIVDLQTNTGSQQDARKHLIKFLKDKSPNIRELFESTSDQNKLGLVINERYINLPPQLALPTLKTLTKHLNESKFTHLVFVSKILLKSRSVNTKIPSKRTKSGESSSQEDQKAEPIIFVNPEEEIIFENAISHSDLDVSSYCDENASWSFGSDVKYIPHRRLMVVDFTNWTSILEKLEQELI